MALKTLATASSLQALGAFASTLSAADIAAISMAITDDSQIATILQGYGFGATAVLATGSTHSNTTLDTLVTVAGGAPLAQIQVNDLVLGIGIPAGTFVQALVSATSVTLSQAATASASVSLAIVRMSDRPLSPLVQGQLVVPKRGILKMLPGDVAALDNTGWPILVSGASINYTGGQWTFV